MSKVNTVIYGFNHDHQGLFIDVAEVIKKLPPNSLIGLELGFYHPDIPYPQFFRKALTHNQAHGDMDMFTYIADYAQKRGHRIAWLESPKVFAKTTAAAIESVKKEYGNLSDEDIAKHYRDILKAHDRLHYVDPDRDLWVKTRSRLMRRNIRLQKPVVSFMGFEHAKDVASVSNKPVVYFNKPNDEDDAKYVADDARLLALRREARKIRRSSR